ncbi:glutathione S-transferase family protein [Kineobactrum salinum]|uniref:Glutathione S-transferase family protein n=1 Tax=Kineobactrum salinum TaxID=2708301 RepID=A0A6C0U055_9GAMM|nr:glutathione S-transferase family protein [Kineobactrum salinum]QIB64969.1 glutathione S-transferase family protein [Kineobactrum salinum]
MNNPLVIYGMPASQPARVIFWACLLKELPFNVITSRDSVFYTDDTNPRGQVPAIVDGDFCLAEMAAIVCYLADKHGWSDLYPEDFQVRARIQEFLHRYHSLVRFATYKLMGAFVVRPLGIRDSVANSSGAIAHHIFNNPYSIMFQDLVKVSYGTDNPLQEGAEAVRAITDFLEKYHFKEGSPYVCNTESVSIADLVCYSELGQLTFANLFDFKDFPKTTRWLQAMSEVPHHEPVHAYNVALGDIVSVPNSLGRFRSANAIGFKALEQTGLVTVIAKD